MLTIFTNLPVDFLQLSRLVSRARLQFVLSQFTNALDQPLQIAAVFKSRPVAIY